jgi:hypothetical protein
MELVNVVLRYVRMYVVYAPSMCTVCAGCISSKIKLFTNLIKRLGLRIYLIIQNNHYFEFLFFHSLAL